MRNELRAGPRVITLGGVDARVLLPARLLATIVSPVYFLWGEHDPFGGAAIARRFAAQVPTSELEMVPGAGHAVWMDDPEHAARMTARWLGQSVTNATPRRADGRD